MQFHGGTAVFQFVGFLHRRKGQLALFADRHKTHIQLIRHHSPQDEAAGIQARHHVGAQRLVHVTVHKSVDQHAKDLGVLKQRGDVPELNPRGGPVRHGTDVLAQVFVDAE
ncbi:hypothetical protein D3C71_1699960 [compost metagenome]